MKKKYKYNLFKENNYFYNYSKSFYATFNIVKKCEPTVRTTTL